MTSANVRFIIFILLFTDLIVLKSHPNGMFFFISFFFLLFSLTFIYFLECTGGVHVLSEDDFQEPVLSFHHAALRKEIQVGRLGSRSLYLLSHVSFSMVFS